MPTAQLHTEYHQIHACTKSLRTSPHLSRSSQYTNTLTDLTNPHRISQNSHMHKISAKFATCTQSAQRIHKRCAKRLTNLTNRRRISQNSHMHKICTKLTWSPRNSLQYIFFSSVIHNTMKSESPPIAMRIPPIDSESRKNPAQADIFTKGLDRKTFSYIRQYLFRT